MQEVIVCNSPPHLAAELQLTDIVWYGGKIPYCGQKWPAASQDLPACLPLMPYMQEGTPDLQHAADNLVLDMLNLVGSSALEVLSTACICPLVALLM